MTDAETAEPPPPEESQMEIHKVKPIHSWRDFLKELGTIVLGIIIAIGLEQVVEDWHWQQEVKVARHAIAAEIAADNENLFAFRVAITPCVEKQLSQVEAILTALESGSDIKKIPLLPARPPASALIRDNEWQSERASQALTHFPRAELALMSRYYGQFEDFKSWEAQEADAWPQLSVLQRPLTGITKSDLIRLRVNFDIAQRAEFLMVLNSRRQLEISRQIGVVPDRADPLRVKNYCTMSETDYRRYRGSQNLR